MDKHRNTNEAVKAFQDGEFNAPDVTTQIAAGWYDWFCEDSSLCNKTKKLYPKVIKILEADRGRRIDGKSTYVWFKNNCPCVGSLYDDFRFADTKTGDVLFTITPSSGHKVDKGQASLWGKENNFSEPLVTGTFADIVKWFRK